MKKIVIIIFLVLLFSNIKLLAQKDSVSPIKNYSLSVHLSYSNLDDFQKNNNQLGLGFFIKNYTNSAFAEVNIAYPIGGNHLDIKHSSDVSFGLEILSIMFKPVKVSLIGGFGLYNLNIKDTMNVTKDYFGLNVFGGLELSYQRFFLIWTNGTALTNDTYRFRVMRLNFGYEFMII